MTNTAKMREKARYYESVLEWHNAALCWQDAINLYPKPTNSHGQSAYGALALNDIAKMESKLKACVYMAQQEKVAA